MRALAFDPFDDVVRAMVERNAGGPAAALVRQLDAELQRAIIVSQAQVPGEIGTRVAFEELDASLRREVVLALPDEVGFARDRLSVLSPLGLALLGAAVEETDEYGVSGSSRAAVRILSVTREGGRS